MSPEFALLFLSNGLGSSCNRSLHLSSSSCLVVFGNSRSSSWLSEPATFGIDVKDPILQFRVNKLSYL